MYYITIFTVISDIINMFTVINTTSRCYYLF